MEYVFPAVFAENTDGTYTITYPDLPGCISEGKSLGNAMYMAQDALTQWIEYLLEEKKIIPSPTNPKAIEIPANSFINLVRADVRDNRAVRRTVSIPKWMDNKAVDAGISLSKVLQEALRNKLNL